MKSSAEDGVFGERGGKKGKAALKALDKAALCRQSSNMAAVQVEASS